MKRKRYLFEIFIVTCIYVLTINSFVSAEPINGRLEMEMPPETLSSENPRTKNVLVSDNSTIQEDTDKNEKTGVSLLTTNNAAYKSPLEICLNNEKEAYQKSLFFLPYKTNYMLPVTYYYSPDSKPVEDDGKRAVKPEVKFQLSFKYKIWEWRNYGNIEWFFAYTQRSFWQAYDLSKSSPFRETNYEPELFMFRWVNDIPDYIDIYGFKNRIITVSFWDHQSNGQSGTKSKSWNRIYASFLFEKLFERTAFYLEIKPWYSLSKDENPDIEKYLGYGEINAIFQMRDSDDTFSLNLKNNLRAVNNRGSYQLNWSFPLKQLVNIDSNLRIYVQYFNGYGESLIDYNHAVNRIGIGLMFFDWFSGS